MGLNSYRTRRDATEPEIRRALSDVGATWMMLDPFDLLVLYRGKVTMLECKTKKGKPTESQELLVRNGWPLVYVRTPEEALQAIGAMR